MRDQPSLSVSALDTTSAAYGGGLRVLLAVALLLLLIGCSQEISSPATSPTETELNSEVPKTVSALQAVRATPPADAVTIQDDTTQDLIAIIAGDRFAYSVRVEPSRGLDLPSLTSATASALARDDRITVTDETVNSDHRTGYPFGKISFSVAKHKPGDEQDVAEKSGQNDAAAQLGRMYVRIGPDGQTVTFISCIGAPDNVAGCDELLQQFDGQSR